VSPRWGRQQDLARHDNQRIDSVNDNVVLHRVEGAAAPVPVGSAPATIAAGTVYRLDVVANGPSFDVYLDGKHMLSGTDASFVAGGIGLRASARATFPWVDARCQSGCDPAPVPPADYGCDGATLTTLTVNSDSGADVVTEKGRGSRWFRLVAADTQNPPPTTLQLRVTLGLAPRDVFQLYLYDDTGGTACRSKPLVAVSEDPATQVFSSQWTDAAGDTSQIWRLHVASVNVSQCTADWSLTVMGNTL
jgi:hypothetical protein